MASPSPVTPPTNPLSFKIIHFRLAKNGVIISVNLRGLRENNMPAELAEIRRRDIYKIQWDN